MTLEEKVLRNAIKDTTTLGSKIALEMRLDKLLKSNQDEKENCKLFNV